MEAVFALSGLLVLGAVLTAVILFGMCALVVMDEIGRGEKIDLADVSKRTVTLIGTHPCVFFTMYGVVCVSLIGPFLILFGAK